MSHVQHLQEKCSRETEKQVQISGPWEVTSVARAKVNRSEVIRYGWENWHETDHAGPFRPEEGLGVFSEKALVLFFLPSNSMLQPLHSSQSDSITTQVILCHSSAQKPPLVLHIRVESKFLIMASRPFLHTLAPHCLSDLSSLSLCFSHRVSASFSHTLPYTSLLLSCS